MGKINAAYLSVSSKTEKQCGNDYKFHIEQIRNYKLLLAVQKELGGFISCYNHQQIHLYKMIVQDKGDFRKDRFQVR